MSDPKKSDYVWPGNNNLTKMWWDLENTPVPKDLQLDYVYERIKYSLALKGFTGPLVIRAVVASAAEKWKPIKDVEIVGLNLTKPTKNAADSAIENEIRLLSKIKRHSPINVLISTGDRFSKKSFDMARSKGHTALGVCRTPVGESKLSDYTKALWEWRSFLLLPKEAAGERVIGPLEADTDEKKNQQIKLRRKEAKKLYKEEEAKKEEAKKTRRGEEEKPSKKRTRRGEEEKPS